MNIDVLCGLDWLAGDDLRDRHWRMLDEIPEIGESYWVRVYQKNDKCKWYDYSLFEPWNVALNGYDMRRSEDLLSVCIVEHEILEDIPEHYLVKVNNIYRVNDLNTETVNALPNYFMTDHGCEAKIGELSYWSQSAEGDLGEWFIKKGDVCLLYCEWGMNDVHEEAMLCCGLPLS